MNTRLLIPLYVAVALLAACGNRDAANTRSETSSAPAEGSDTATTPGPAGDTATTPGGNAGDTEPGSTPSDTPPSPPPPSGS